MWKKPQDASPHYSLLLLPAADNCHAQNGHSPLAAWRGGLGMARASISHADVNDEDARSPGRHAAWFPFDRSTVSFDTTVILVSSSSNARTSKRRGKWWRTKYILFFLPTIWPVISVYAWEEGVGTIWAGVTRTEKKGWEKGSERRVAHAGERKREGR